MANDKVQIDEFTPYLPTQSDMDELRSLREQECWEQQYKQRLQENKAQNKVIVDFPF